MHGQAGAATEQGMDAIPTQQGTGMVRWSVTRGCIGIGSTPDQDGSTINLLIVLPSWSGVEPIPMQPRVTLQRTIPVPCCVGIASIPCSVAAPACPCISCSPRPTDDAPFARPLLELAVRLYAIRP